MDYNQQRRSRGGYGYRHQMNYGQQMASRGDCGCQSAQARNDCERRPGPEKRGCGCQDGQERNDNNRRSNPESRNCGCQANQEKHDCGCGDAHGEKEKKEFVLGMAYVPWQRWNRTYDPHRALMSGTIFPELDKPFCAAGRCSR